MSLEYQQQTCLQLVNETVGNLSSTLLSCDAINCVCNNYPGPSHIILTGHEGNGNLQKPDVHAAN